MTWGYATAADVEAYYGYRPQETLRALIVKLDGRPVVIMGIAKEPERDRVFSEYKPEAKDHLKRMPVLRAIKQLMRWVEANRVPMYAMSDGTGILERLGFVHWEDDVYIWAT